MDLTFTPEHDAFRMEARAWLEANVPPPGALRSLDTAEGFDDHRVFERQLFDARWSVVSWPKAYGGREVGIMEWLIFEEEYYRAGGPRRVSQNGIFLLAPTMFEYATDAQLERYMAKHNLDLGSARIAQIDLAYHDITRSRGLYYLLEARGAVARVTRDLEVFEAKSVPPQTTRARLRGEFIKRAQERRRDFTVEWVHLKLNDQAQRTVLCKDPFAFTDERVDKLIASM